MSRKLEVLSGLQEPPPEVEEKAPAVVVKGYNEGYTDGSNNGIDIGYEEGKIYVAKKMKRKGCPVSEIAEISGLPLSEIERLD